jgi:hypothetical protein
MAKMGINPIMMSAGELESGNALLSLSTTSQATSLPSVMKLLPSRISPSMDFFP